MISAKLITCQAGPTWQGLGDGGRRRRPLATAESPLEATGAAAGGTRRLPALPRIQGSQREAAGAVELAGVELAAAAGVWPRAGSWLQLAKDKGERKIRGGSSRGVQQRQRRLGGGFAGDGRAVEIHGGRS